MMPPAAHGLVELSFDLGAMDSEAAEAACFECGASSVTFVDAQDDPAAGVPVLEPLPGEFRLWPATRLKALFANVEQADELASRLGAQLGLGPELIRIQSVQDRVWEREWLRDFHAMRFGKRLWICPHHEEVNEPHARVVHMDPGLAFGTGTHPTTRLCLEWLDEHLGLGARVIDYGCGSGVLAVAAATLGASEAHCFDIDPQALLATHANALANGLSAFIRIHQSTDTLPHGADTLIANILSGPLCELAARFATLVRPGGTVVLAGLLLAQQYEVTRAYSACFDMAPFGEREGWVGLSGRRLSCTPSAPSAP
jgi:ribosomal protein L11 methyltransferase